MNSIFCWKLLAFKNTIIISVAIYFINVFYIKQNSTKIFTFIVLFEEPYLYNI